MNMAAVAREAGVSTMTVSRALRHDPKVSPGLRLKIQEIAARLGYRPNPLVSALMSQRRAGRHPTDQLKLGFITNFASRDGWREERLYREFYDGATRAAERQGYRLEEFWLREPGMTARRLSRILVTRNIHGVILAPLPDAEGRLELVWEDLCAIAIGYSISEPGLHRVSNHQFRSMAQLMPRLHELGYRRPGLALPQSLNDRVLRQWLAGFLVEQTSFEDSRVPAFIKRDEEWMPEPFENWLDAYEPDVVIGLQKQLIDWVQASGRRIPEDIGVALLDCPAPNDRLSGIYQNGPEVGAAAADALIAMLHQNERGLSGFPRTVLISGSWVPGATLRAQVPARKAGLL